MNTHVAGFQSFFQSSFLHHFVSDKFATSSIGVNAHSVQKQLDNFDDHFMAKAQLR